MKAGTYTPYAPNGKCITGTLEMIPGIAQVLNVEVSLDGVLEPVWEGETDVDWDGQETQYEGFERIYIDADGTRWRESELVLVPEGADAPSEVSHSRNSRNHSLSACSTFPHVEAGEFGPDTPSDPDVCESIRTLLQWLQSWDADSIPLTEWAHYVKAARAYGVESGK